MMNLKWKAANASSIPADMKKKYNFSKGERGRFTNPDGKFNLPICLEREIAKSVEKNVDRNQIVNRLLVKDMETIDLGPTHA